MAIRQYVGRCLTMELTSDGAAAIAVASLRSRSIWCDRIRTIDLPTCDDEALAIQTCFRKKVVSGSAFFCFVLFYCYYYFFILYYYCFHSRLSPQQLIINWEIEKQKVRILKFAKLFLSLSPIDRSSYRLFVCLLLSLYWNSLEKSVFQIGTIRGHRTVDSS